MEEKNNENKLSTFIKAESTWLNPAISSKDDLINWILVNLGWPTLTVELEENQLNVCIQNALEKYTKYASFGADKFLVVPLKNYKYFSDQKPIIENLENNKKEKEFHEGLDLTEFNIACVKDISFQRDNAFSVQGDLFWSSYAFLGQGGGMPFFNNGSHMAGSWVTWHAVQEFFDLTKRMMGSTPDWIYDKETKFLRLMPSPSKQNLNEYILLTCQVEPDLSQLYGNEYVKRLTLAYAKILLGTIRKKFQNTQLIGGGSIDISIGDEGKEELEKIMEDIIKDESIGQTWVIA